MSRGKAALYLRSSKDRAEVSLDAQRHELAALAKVHSLEIVKSYDDAVFSGSNEDRPAFQQLIADIKNPARGWTTLLVFDTSRIARGRYIAQAFKHECRRRDVELVIAKMPETDPVSTVILESVFEAMDEVHSIMSREKGLAGMRQNIAKGFRAGGIAPAGYRLIHEPTGGMRDSKPVLKSKLGLSEDAELVRQFLKARAVHEPRAAVARRLGITWPTTTLVAMEWNALVYAGHTVWNRHREKKLRGDGLTKRRPRAEWVIQRDTHPALISDAEAETIMASLENSKIGEAVRQSRAHSSDFLLSGLLQTSDGRPWVGAGARYRLKPAGLQSGKYIDRKQLETAVLSQIRQDIADDDFIARLTQATREFYPDNDPTADLEREAKKLEREAERAARMAVESSEPGPFVSLVETKRQQAAALRRQAQAAIKDSALSAAARKLTPEAIRSILADDETGSGVLRGLVARVVLEPSLRCAVHYGHSLGMASPKGFEPLLPP